MRKQVLNADVERKAMLTLDSNHDAVATPEVAGPASLTPVKDGRLTASHGTAKVHWEAMPCEGPGCTNVLPEGLYAPQRLRSFCSTACGNRDASSQCVIGACLYCSVPIMGRKDYAGKRHYCSDEHWRTHTTERILGPTGPFRPLIEEY